MEGKELCGTSWEVAPFQRGVQGIYLVWFCIFSFQSISFRCARFYSRGPVHAEDLSTSSNLTVNYLAGSARDCKIQ